MRDGIAAAAMREKEYHPKLKNGNPITAWDRRANSLLEQADRIQALESKVNGLPFPFAVSSLRGD